jgi:hypothetical protein
LSLWPHCDHLFIELASLVRPSLLKGKPDGFPLIYPFLRSHTILTGENDLFPCNPFLKSLPSRVLKNTRNRNLLILAERERFELSIRYYPYSGLANRRPRPLGDLSDLKLIASFFLKKLFKQAGALFLEYALLYFYPVIKFSIVSDVKYRAARAGPGIACAIYQFLDPSQD